MRHVRSHTLVPGNEVADWLADAGVAGGTTQHSVYRKLVGWFHEHSVDISGDARERRRRGEST